MSRVEWTRRAPEEVESVLGIMLLRRFEESAQRIRPAKGDRGIDIVVRDLDGIVVYQVKSFTSSMTSSHKRQITKSWNRFKDFVEESDADVKAWYLLRPLNPTLPDTAWLNKLTMGSRFECGWLGLDFCDGLVAEFPDVVDYYLFDGKERLNDSVALLSRIIDGGVEVERSGALDPVGSYSTLDALHQAINRFDPHYFYDFSVETVRPDAQVPDGLSDVPGLVAAASRTYYGRTITFKIFARYPQAADDRPCPIRFEVDVPAGSDEEQAWLDLMRYGLPVDRLTVSNLTIDLPGGLGSTETTGFVSIGAAQSALARPFDLMMTVRDLSGATVAETRLHMRPATTGLDLRGFATSGTAEGNAFSITLKFHQDEPTHVELEARDLTGVSPTAALASVRVLAAMRPPNLIVFWPPGGHQPDDASELSTPIADELEMENVLAAVDALSTIERYAIPPVSIPDLTTITLRELHSWKDAASLLEGAVLDRTWKRFQVSLPPERPFTIGDLAMLEFKQQFVVTVGTQRVELGWQAVMLETARFVSVDANGETATFEPAMSDRSTIRRDTSA